MYSNYSMQNRNGYYSNNERGVVPFLVGGAIGYGIGSSFRPRPYFVPMPFPLGYPMMPPFRPPMGGPIYVRPPFWRR